MNDTTATASFFNAQQQFILDYAALCERSGIFVAIDCLPGVFLQVLDNPAPWNHSRLLVRLIAGVDGAWCSELKSLFLKHAVINEAIQFTVGVLSVAENVSIAEWAEAGGSDYDRDSYIASEVRDFVRNSRPGTHFSNQLTRWYLHAVENDL